MSDLDVVAVITAKAGSEAVLQAALEGLVEPTRAEEGCISYHLFQSAAEPTTFVTIEKWRSQSDLDAHTQTEHMAQAVAAAEDAIDAAPAIHPLRPVSD